MIVTPGEESDRRAVCGWGRCCSGGISSA